ncbi:PREDICTED: FRAS1-related extracellular matrix protein 2, partial [Tinamus guttatus]|uniref:FRAS1-related extracellular matrix protein 2 n=1 Tax=Tinamus guttatus TaxID=94827 RepID=UPI00052E8EE6
ACNPKYEDFDKTGSICASENINNTLTQYRWLVSAPTGPDGITSPMKEIDFDTFFTSSKMITLDSIYFQAGSRVQCAARAVNSDGNEGLELMSPIVTISVSEGLCQPRMSGAVGAEPFSAKLRYTGPEDPDYVNLIKLTVTMPHIDVCVMIKTKRFEDVLVLNLVQSYVTLRVPLYVSYVFHSPVGVGGWQHFDLQSELRLTFVYDTAILWKDGIGSPPEAELQGSLYPTSMRISDEGRLVVNFKTEARFHGLFVMSHSASPLTSMVLSADHPGLTFSLSLIRSEPTYNQPRQQWSFVSDFAVRDYSGTYTVKLIACTTAPHQEYSLPVICNPREPITFDLDIRFQQVSDPVAAEFSLNTQMFLLSKKTLWLSDGSMGFGQESDVAFAEGDIIYGRVMVDPVQNLGDSFYCSIEKVFLCTGADGYVPKYNPSNTEYGCLADSPSLLYRFKIVDKAQPETQATSFGNVLFNAKLAVDDPEAIPLVKQPGSDGFKMDSTPLFQVSLGREWYVHTIYTVRSKENANRGIGKRSVEHQYHSVSSAGSPGAAARRRQKRDVEGAPELAKDIGAEKKRGTNIQHVALDRANKKQVPPREVVVNGVLPRELSNPSPEVSIVTVTGGTAAVLLAICLVAIIILLLKRRQSSEKKDATKESGSSEPMMLPYNCPSDSSEV